MSHPEPATPVIRRTGTAGLVVQMTLGSALAGFVAALLGASVAGSTINLTAGILIRGVLALLLLLLIGGILGRRAKQSGVSRPILVLGVGALLGFLLDPLTWQARTLLTQLVTEPGMLTVIGDLGLWMLTALAGVRLGTSGAVPPPPTDTPYG